MLYLYGDSITEGLPGSTFCTYLRDLEPVNRGLAGDSLIGLSRRFAFDLKHGRIAAGDTAVFFIGTNDVLTPFLHRYTMQSRVLVEGQILRGSVPVESVEDYSARYAALLRRASRGKVKALVVGVPVIETLAFSLDAQASELDGRAEAAAKAAGVPFIDIRSAQLAVKRIMNNHGSYFPTGGATDTLLDTIFTKYLPFASTVSAHRGLALTIDGIHFNPRSARLLARLVRAKLPAARVPRTEGI